jgi:hypothetical protein
VFTYLVVCSNHGRVEDASGSLLHLHRPGRGVLVQKQRQRIVKGSICDITKEGGDNKYLDGLGN